MKKNILFMVFSFVCVLSYAQFDFWEVSLREITTAPSYLVVKVKSPSYEGEAVILNHEFMRYCKAIKNDTSKFYDEIWFDEDWKLACQEILQGRYFIISDEDLLNEYHNINQKFYTFKKIIVNDSVLDISKKGLEFFIRTYFDDEGYLIRKEPFDYYTIVKVMFDARIQAGLGCIRTSYCILDSRFYNEEGFTIPPEYKDR